MGDGIVKARPQIEAVGINKKALYIALAVFGIVMTIVLFLATTPKPRMQQSVVETHTSPATRLASLPASYAEMPLSIPTTRPTVAAIPTQPTVSELERLMKEIAAEKLKRKLEAQHSKVTFTNFEGFLSAQSSSRTESTENSNDPKNQNEAKSSRDDDNRQDDKLVFLNNASQSETVLQQSLQAPTTPYHILAGTVIPGVLLTKLNSDLPGNMIGQISENVYDSTTGKYLLLPQGSKLLGKYDSRVTYGQERLLVVWSRIILPTGKSLFIENMSGIDQEGSAGLTGDVDNHLDKLLTGVVLTSLLGAGAQLAQGNSFNNINPGYDELAVRGFAQNTNTVGQQITRRNLAIQPTILVPAGSRFSVMVNKDLMLTAYEAS